MQPLVSVIVPVYKVEAYLEQCVRSLCAQTYQNLEILLVDDGSPDRCPQLCEELAARDGRIRVLHKQNGGLSDARNAGTAQARGDYVTYVDSDDWAAPRMVEVLCSALQAAGADLAVCDVVKVADGASAPECGAIPAGTVYSGVDALGTMLYQGAFDTTASAKLFTREAAQAHLFPVGCLYEDLFTVYKLLYGAKTVVHTAAALYYYRQNPDSITHQKFTLRMLDQLTAADSIEAFVREQCPQLLPAALSRKFSAYAQVLRLTTGAEDPAQVEAVQRRIWAFLRQYRWRMLADGHARPKNRAAALLTLLGRAAFMKINR